MIDQYTSNLDIYVLKKSYEYADWLDKNPDSSIGKLGVSIVCGLGEVIRSVIDTERLVSMGIRSILNQRLETGNIQVGVVKGAEHIRNIVGSFFVGSALAFYSPETARKYFLPHNDSLLPKVLDKTKAAKLYATFYEIKTFFEKYDIDYRMTSGTFLGAIRHKGIIPWDDDIDLFVYPSSCEKLEKLINEKTFENETGLKTFWDQRNEGWRAFYEDGDECPSVLGETKFPFIDLFKTEFKNDRIVYQSSLMYGWAPQEYYTRIEWYDMKEYPFGPLTIKGPKNPEGYFNRAFGNGAMDFAYLLYHHKDFKFQNWPQRVVVTTKTAVEYDANLYQELIKKG